MAQGSPELQEIRFLYLFIKHSAQRIIDAEQRLAELTQSYSGELSQLDLVAILGPIDEKVHQVGRDTFPGSPLHRR